MARDTEEEFYASRCVEQYLRRTLPMQAPIVQTLAHPQSLVEDLVDVFFTYSSGCSNKLDPLSHQKGKRHSCTLFWTVPNGCTPNSRAARPALISPNRSNSITKASCAFRLAWAMCSSDTPVRAWVNLTSISGAVISLALGRDRTTPLYNIQQAKCRPLPARNWNEQLVKVLDKFW